jgi:hypothetical protein
MQNSHITKFVIYERANFIRRHKLSPLPGLSTHMQIEIRFLTIFAKVLEVKNL